MLSSSLRRRSLKNIHHVDNGKAVGIINTCKNPLKVGNDTLIEIMKFYALQATWIN
jgi:hypothetical protein